MATSFKAGVPGETTDHGQATGKLYHMRLRVECTLFCNLQSRAWIHAVLVIGLYELLGNPTTLTHWATRPSVIIRKTWSGTKIRNVHGKCQAPFKFKIIAFFMITLIARLYVSVGILLSCGKHLHDHIISLRGEVLGPWD